MKKSVAKATIMAALAIFIAGVCFLCFLWNGADSDGSSQAKSQGEQGGSLRVVRQVVRGEKKKVRPQVRLPNMKRGVALPDQFVRFSIQHAIDDEDYNRLAALLKYKDAIKEASTRLQLVDALGWFDETAAQDVVGFLDDKDEAVRVRAADILTQKLPHVVARQKRGKIYVEAMKKMQNSPELDMLLASLDGEGKGVVLSVVLGMEETCKLRPTLWKKLTCAYEEHFDRAYTTRNDALMHFNPYRDDD